MSLRSKKSLFNTALLYSVLNLVTVNSANATIVEFSTSHGDFKINLHDETTPITVQNFLNYVQDQDYNNTIIHRVEDNFVLQGGGFTFEGELPLTAIETDPAITNEPVYSNVRGTIAMAKVSGNANSATSQWFINLNDNSVSGAQLDLQNGGFSVFGEVVVNDSEDGMAVIDAIAALPRCNAIPVTENSDTVCQSPSSENFVTIYSVTIFDNTVNTDANLNSVRNTSINQLVNVNDDPISSDSGGSLSGLALFMVGLFSLYRVRKIKGCAS